MSLLGVVPEFLTQPAEAMGLPPKRGRPLQRPQCQTPGCKNLILHGYRFGQPPTESRFCLPCRAQRRRLGTKKYYWPAELDIYLRRAYYGSLKTRHKVLDYLVAKSGFPRWYIKKQAGRLGLGFCYDRRNWTPAETNLLLKYVGQMSVDRIAMRLHRSITSVVLKIKRMKLSRRMRNGYTVQDLELGLGEDHRKIHTWIEKGWLTAHRQKTKRRFDIQRIRESAVRDFVRDYPNEIRLAKVNQLWFLSLVFRTANGIR